MSCERRDDRLDGYIEDKEYYRATYHRPDAAIKLFEGLLSHIVTVEAANALVQDFVVFKKAELCSG